MKDRKNEKGAAMVMVLLISLLLLTASAGLLMESSMNTQNVSDATAEQQAYNAAETGLQATINVLRGNVKPDPLLDPAKPSTDKSNLISFRRAIALTSSNNENTSTTPRLSRWLNYNYKSTGSAFNDRVVLGAAAASYQPNTGYAYSVSMSDPDRTNEIVKFNTVGEFNKGGTTWLSELTEVVTTTVGTATVKITYEPADNSPEEIDVKSGSHTANFGKFKILVSPGVGAVVFDKDFRFRIITNMTAPYSDTGVMRGWIKLKGVDLRTAANVQFDFDSPAYDLSGSIFTLNNDPLNIPVIKAVTGQATEINGTVTSAEPFRVVITSTGYGPRGAKKVLEATVQKNFFNGLSAPATLTLIGKTDNFYFTPGTSANVTYSGDDISSTINLPSIGTNNDSNLTKVINSFADPNVKATTDPPAENVSMEIPFWLQSTENLDNTLRSLRGVAESSLGASGSRLFTGGRVPARSDFGNLNTGTGITYIEGDASLRGEGGGILVCTGKLTLDGDFKFKGLIVVTGYAGIARAGTGDGYLYGNTVVAPYDPNNLGLGFLSPRYDLNGGGTSKIQYDSSSVNNGMTAVSNFVLGVAEK